MSYIDELHERKAMESRNFDVVNKPEHYNSHPSGIECIQITEHMNFCLGNAIKYIFRSGIKTNDPKTDLKKAIWYLQRELLRLDGDV